MKTYKNNNNEKKSKILVIGYDPNIQSSESINEYCFDISLMREDNKIKRVEAVELVYSYIKELTNNKYDDKEIYFMNICRDELQYTPKSKKSFIQTNKSQQGIDRINFIIEKNDIEYIFAMSLEINYWLQEVGFYNTNNEYFKGLYEENNNINSNSNDKLNFREICGKVYKVKNKDIKIIPILQHKQYLINKSIKKHYEVNYSKIKSQFQS